MAPTGHLGRIGYLARKHPLASGAASVAFLAAISLLGVNSWSSRFTEFRNPSSFRYNLATDRVEIRNAHGDSLWTFAGGNLADERQYESLHSLSQTAIADLDGDGRNEVITTLRQPTNDPYRKDDPNPILLLNWDGSLRRSIQLADTVKYKGRTYIEPWFADAFLILPDSTGVRSEILATWTCYRSPSVVMRIGSNGEVLGKYWHFGQFFTLTSTDVDGDGRSEVLLGGVNDVADSVSGEFGALIMIDPERIVGSSRTSTAPRFDLPASAAERYYLRLPNSPIGRVLEVPETPAWFSRSRPELISLSTRGQLKDGTAWGFEYYFRGDMTPMMVKDGGFSTKVQMDLVNRNFLSGLINNAYLDRLRDGIRFWDGQAWTNIPSQVR